MSDEQTVKTEEEANTETTETKAETDGTTEEPILTVNDELAKLVREQVAAALAEHQQNVEQPKGSKPPKQPKPNPPIQPKPALTQWQREEEMLKARRLKLIADGIIK